MSFSVSGCARLSTLECVTIVRNVTRQHLAQVLLLLAALGSLAIAIASLSSGDSTLGLAFVAVAAGFGTTTYLQARRTKLT